MVRFMRASRHVLQALLDNAQALALSARTAQRRAMPCWPVGVELELIVS
jgi:hypothetical protein